MSGTYESMREVVGVVTIQRSHGHVLSHLRADHRMDADWITGGQLLLTLDAGGRKLDLKRSLINPNYACDYAIVRIEEGNPVINYLPGLQLCTVSVDR